MLTERQKQKELTRKKILTTAARLLKRNGFSETSLQTVMSGAGLTHGAFYAYFKNKNRLIAESFAWAINEVNERVAANLEASGIRDPRARLRSFLGFYLSPHHRQEVENGCPVSALARDFGAAPAGLKKEFARELQILINRRRELFSSAERPMSQEHWLGIMSCIVGALVLSRAAAGTPLSDQILKSAFEYLNEAENLAATGVENGNQKR